MATDVVGRPIERVDGRLKVTGAARYAADTPVEGVAHAVIVQSTIARGRAAIDAAEAERAPGVLAVITPRNMPRLRCVKADFSGGGAPGGGTMLGEDRLPLQDDAVHYAGQHLAVVVAETLEQARHAASLVRVTYEAERPLLALDDPTATVEEPEEFWRGAPGAPGGPGRRLRPGAGRGGRRRGDLHDPLRAAHSPGAVGHRGGLGRRPAHRVRLDPVGRGHAQRPRASQRPRPRRAAHHGRRGGGWRTRSSTRLAGASARCRSRPRSCCRGLGGPPLHSEPWRATGAVAYSESSVFRGGGSLWIGSVGAWRELRIWRPVVRITSGGRDFRPAFEPVPRRRDSRRTAG